MTTQDWRAKTALLKHRLSKFNPNHDELGRFSSGPGGGGATGDWRAHGGTKGWVKDAKGVLRPPPTKGGGKKPRKPRRAPTKEEAADTAAAKKIHRFLTGPKYRQLVNNHEENAAIQRRGSANTVDHKPVVKFFDMAGAATWLVSEYNPSDGMAYGVADLGVGQPELGSFHLGSWKEALKTNWGSRFDQDRGWKAKKTASEYATEARNVGRIVS